MRHTTTMHETVGQLKRIGNKVTMEGENCFETTSSRTGSISIGRPDVISVSPSKGCTVIEIKTGQPQASDEFQVKLYMLLLPLSSHPRWNGVRLDGQVLYVNGLARNLLLEDITPKFRENLAIVMRQVVAPEPPRKMPSLTECGRCVLSSNICPERVEPTAV